MRLCVSISSKGKRDFVLILLHAQKCAMFNTVRHCCFDSHCFKVIIQNMVGVGRTVASNIFFKNVTKVNLVASYALPTMKNGKFEGIPLY